MAQRYLATCIFVLFHSLCSADSPINRVDQAIEEHLAILRALEDEALREVDAMIEQYADKGDLDKVLFLKQQRLKMLGERRWPDSPMLAGLRRQVRFGQAKANRQLEGAFKDAIADLTRGRDFARAEALQKELAEMRDLHAALREREKQTAGENKNTNGNWPTPLKKSAEPADPDLLVSGKVQAVIKSFKRNPLLPEDDQSRALRDQILAIYDMQHPPSDWTQAQVSALALLFRDFIRETGFSHFDGPWEYRVSEGFLRRSGSWEWVDDPSKMEWRWAWLPWLMGSKDSLVFSQRARRIQEEPPAAFSVFDKAFTSEECLKPYLVWLGCTRVEKAVAVLEAWQKDGVKFSAVKQLLEELRREQGDAQK